MPNRKLKKMTAGGRRPGAGKPRLSDEDKRKNTTFRLSPETVRRIGLIRAAGMLPGRVIDDLVEAFCIHAGLEPDLPPDGVCEIQN